MASGKKNYFRHSFFARKHPAIAGLIDDLGKEAYFHFFALVEVCAEQASDKYPDGGIFVFRRSTLCRELLVTNSRLSRHLLAMVPSLVDDIVVTENNVQLVFPKLAKYMGRYDSKLESNSPNKRKEKERKEKETEEPLSLPESLPTPKKNLPKVQSQKIPKTPLFALEAPQLEEEIELSDLARNALTAINTICGKAFRPVPGNMKHINARVKEGYKLEDFAKVLKFMQHKWGNDPKMCAYLRPETIFGTKFDSYLQESENADKPKIDPLDRLAELHGIFPNSNDEVSA